MGTLNAQKYLPELLDSLARQSLQPCELVVCDDGSADGTPELVEEFARKVAYPVRIFRNEVRLRPAKNFEKAMSLCQGEFIALCDADDVWYPEKLATLAAVLESDPDIGGVFSDADLIDDRSASMNERLWERALFDPSRAESRTLSAQRLLRGNVVTGATLMVRASLREVLLPVPETWIHDGWIAWMLVLHSKIVACRKCLIGYRIHPSQQTGMSGVTPIARLRRARETGPEDYYSVAAQFADMLQYARAHPGTCGEDLCSAIEKKRDHALFRAQLKPKKLIRWREIVSRRLDYAAYDKGWLSMLRDALL
ncbi:MAG: glycosyltransferase [Acidobacteriaceae bacterium]